MTEDGNGFCIRLGLCNLVLRVRQIHRSQDGLDQDEDFVGGLFNLFESIAYVMMRSQLIVHLRERFKNMDLK